MERCWSSTTGGVRRSVQVCEGGSTNSQECACLQGNEVSEFAMEPAASEGELWIADCAAPVALDGVGSTAGAGEEEGEGVAEGEKLVEVDVSARQAVKEGDGLERDEEEIGGVGAGLGDGILGPLTEVVDVRAGKEELASSDSVGGELAGANVVAVVEEVMIAPAHEETVVAAAPVDEKRYRRQIDEEEGV